MSAQQLRIVVGLFGFGVSMFMAIRGRKTQAGILALLAAYLVISGVTGQI